MKKIIIAMAALAAVFTMASCNKEQLVEQEENTALGNCIITASTENNLTKTSLEGDDENGYEVVWSEDDTFNLGGNTFTLIDGAGTTSGTFQGNVPGTNGFKTAFYPASYDGSNWPTKQTYTKGNITGSPMKADVYCMRGEISGEKWSSRTSAASCVSPLREVKKSRASWYVRTTLPTSLLTAVME